MKVIQVVQCRQCKKWFTPVEVFKEKLFCNSQCEGDFNKVKYEEYIVKEIRNSN